MNSFENPQQHDNLMKTIEYNGYKMSLYRSGDDRLKENIESDYLPQYEIMIPLLDNILKIVISLDLFDGGTSIDVIPNPGSGLRSKAENEELDDELRKILLIENIKKDEDLSSLIKESISGLIDAQSKIRKSTGEPESDYRIMILISRLFKDEEINNDFLRSIIPNGFKYYHVLDKGEDDDGNGDIDQFEIRRD